MSLTDTSSGEAVYHTYEWCVDVKHTVSHGNKQRL